MLTLVIEYLKGTKDTVSSCSPNKDNIQERTKWPPAISWLNRKIFTSSLKKEVAIISWPNSPLFESC